jgi:hypothetical protein
MKFILVKWIRNNTDLNFSPTQHSFHYRVFCEAALNVWNSSLKTVEHNFEKEFKRIIQVFLQDMTNIMFNMKIRKYVNKIHSGFGGLVVSVLSTGTQVRRFKPGRSRWIFQASEKSSALSLTSEGKWKNLSHVPALRHVKEASTSVNYECASKMPCIVPSFAGWGLSCLYGTWRLWRWMRELIGAKGTIGL